MSLRIVFMGTPDFAVPCLESMVSNGHKLLAVVTQPDRPKGRGHKLACSPVKQAAVNLGLDILQPERVKEQAFLEKLRGLSPDVIVVVAFGQILPQEILDLPRLGCINVHASLLPKYRGAAPIHYAVINGEKITGVTTMYMDAGMDTGDMILTKTVEIGPNNTTGDIHDALMVEGAKLLVETLSLMEQGKAPRIPQNGNEATYASKLNHTLEKINWSLSAEEIHNLIRGLSPWPGAYCIYQNEHIMKIWKTRVVSKAKSQGSPGEIVGHTQDGFIVAAGSGTVEVLEVQPQSKRRMKAIDCVCGYCLNEGEILL